MTLEVLPLTGLPEVRPGDDLAGVLAGAARDGGLDEGDVLVVTQKVVSKAEGRLVPGDDRSSWIEKGAPGLDSPLQQVVGTKITTSSTGLSRARKFAPACQWSLLISRFRCRPVCRIATCVHRRALLSSTAMRATTSFCLAIWNGAPVLLTRQGERSS